MVIENHTPYDTGFLYRMMVRIYAKVVKEEGGPLQDWDEILVEVRPRKDGYSNGWAIWDVPRRMVLRIPIPNGRRSGTCTTVGMAGLFVHELKELYGCDHEDMDEDLTDPKKPYDWETRWVERNFGQYLPFTG